MALVSTDQFRSFYKVSRDEPSKVQRKARDILEKVTDAPWESSGLVENNAFTTTLVLRTFGFLVEQKVIDTSANKIKKAWKLQEQLPNRHRRSFHNIAVSISSKPENFSINKYPPSAAVIYWFIDGISRGNIELPGLHWKGLCDWASHEFHRQRSLVLAEHDAMMDPVAMAMAACLCARLRSIGEKAGRGVTEKHWAKLPSAAELEHSIKELFRRQRKSGIWPKYFPLFHYQQAGSNFCFTFELLEAVLHEFGEPENDLLADATFIEGLENAITWCEKNRLSCAKGKSIYNGWNSGGYFKTLEMGQPESWATAVVHMFLEELRNAVSRCIQRQLLEKYKPQYLPKTLQEGAITLKSPDEAFDGFLDIRVLLQERGKRYEPKADLRDTSLKRILIEEMVLPLRLRSGADLRREAAKPPISALLFGPPGTSKTEITKAVAKALDWQLVVINPSEFVKGTLENVYLRADEIFKDLMDLSGVVVFFDEMDALTQSREGPLDTFTQFLTTSMLPKLSELHDKGQVVYFMATNHQENFDFAIKRAGRFDLLLCIGPPSLGEKLHRLPAFFPKSQDTKEIEKARKLLRSFIGRDSKLRTQLELLTFAEFRSLLKDIGNETNIGAQLANLSAKTFKKIAEEYTDRYVSLKIGDLAAIRFRSVRDLDKIPLDQFKAISKTAIGKYLQDRRASNRQY